MGASLVYWVDASGVSDAQALFGLAPLERIRRTLKKQGVPESDIIVSTDTGSLCERLSASLKANPVAHIVIDSAALSDPRLIRHLASDPRSVVAMTGEGEEKGAALRLQPGVYVPADVTDILSLAERLRESGIPLLMADEFQGFIGVLRRDLPYYVYQVPDLEKARSRERWMFFVNYKGSTDILTKWVFPPLVWPITRFCAANGIHPNVVTVISILLTLAAIPLFVAGAFAAGLACAYIMAVLDSVDGKLARVTLTDSPIGNVLDHGLDIVHPPFWYLAWAYGLVGIGFGNWVINAAWWMASLYVLDRLILMVAKARFKRGLHAMTVLDGAIRAVISRRNTNLILLTLGLATGAHGAAFLAVVLWQGATAVWHGVRTAMLFRMGAQA